MALDFRNYPENKTKEIFESHEKSLFCLIKQKHRVILCWVNGGVLIYDHHRVKGNVDVFIHMDFDLELPDVVGTFYHEIWFIQSKRLVEKAHGRVNLLSCKQS